MIWPFFATSKLMLLVSLRKYLLQKRSMASFFGLMYAGESLAYFTFEGCICGNSLWAISSEVLSDFSCREQLAKRAVMTRILMYNRVCLMIIGIAVKSKYNQTKLGL